MKQFLINIIKNKSKVGLTSSSIMNLEVIKKNELTLEAIDQVISSLMPKEPEKLIIIKYIPDIPKTRITF